MAKRCKTWHAGAKRKGREHEAAIAAMLTEALGVQVERRRLAGVADAGDLTDIPAGPFTVVSECKNCRAIDLPGWTREAVAEAGNAAARFGWDASRALPVVWARRRGSTEAGEGYAILPAAVMVKILAALRALP